MKICAKCEEVKSRGPTLTKQEPEDAEISLGFDLRNKLLLNNNTLKIQLWDTFNSLL